MATVPPGGPGLGRFCPLTLAWPSPRGSQCDPPESGVGPHVFSVGGLEASPLTQSHGWASARLWGCVPSRPHLLELSTSLLSQAPDPSQASRQLGSRLDGACMRAGVWACPRPPGRYRAVPDTGQVLDMGTRV